jgi:hypothetical protein
MTSQEKYLRMGKLAELGQELEATKKRVERRLEEIRVLSFPLDGVESVDAAALVQATQELAVEQTHLADLRRRIDELSD